MSAAKSGTTERDKRPTAPRPSTRTERVEQVARHYMGAADRTKGSTMTPPTNPKPAVMLVGADGNAFNILGLCQRAARKAGWPPERIGAVMQDMRSGDYDHLLQVAMREFEVR